MTLPNADVAAMFATVTALRSRLECTAHDCESFVRQLGYLVADWPHDERALDPAFSKLTATIEDVARLAKLLRQKAEE